MDGFSIDEMKEVIEAISELKFFVIFSAEDIGDRKTVTETFYFLIGIKKYFRKYTYQSRAKEFHEECSAVCEAKSRCMMPN